MVGAGVGGRELCRELSTNGRNSTGVCDLEGCSTAISKGREKARKVRGGGR